jgi:hypothetical protein
MQLKHMHLPHCGLCQPVHAAIFYVLNLVGLRRRPLNDFHFAALVHAVQYVLIATVSTYTCLPGAAMPAGSAQAHNKGELWP